MRATGHKHSEFATAKFQAFKSMGTRTLGLAHVTGFKPMLGSRVGRVTNHSARRTGVKDSGTRCYARYRDIADRYLEG